MTQTIPEKGRSRVVAYSAVLALMAIVGLFSHFADDSPAILTVLKISAVPVLFMAGYGADRMFATERAFRRWTPAYCERVGVTSLVMAIGVAFLLFRWNAPLGDLVWNITSMFVIFCLLSIFGPLNRPKFPVERDKEGEPSG